MLFSYRLVPHGFTRLHEFVEHLVLEVWCHASGDFSLDKINDDFREMVRQQAQIETPIREIYELCSLLTQGQQTRITQIFTTNNDVESVCEGRLIPFRYDALETISPQLRTAVEFFCKRLYTNFCELVHIRSACGSLDDYFDAFVTVNKQGKCPFCGLSDLKSAVQSVRDAFDHFLSKDRYPFNSVNPANLVPTCYTCNSLYKNQKDPVFDRNGQQRRVFYPFSATHTDIRLGVHIKKLDPTHWEEYQVKLECDDVEEINVWREMYGIDEQYSAKCCGEGKQWLEMMYEYILEIRRDNDLPLVNCFEQYTRPLRKRPFTDSNFLRVPFFEDAVRQGYLR